MNIPDGVNYIGMSAFRECSSLPTFQIPQGVITIDSYAFQGCATPTELVIPDKVEQVGWDAFYGCSGLEDVTIGRSVKKLAGGTFYGCDNIWEVWSYVEEPFDVTDYEDIHYDIVYLGKCFPDAVTSRAILHVPEGTTEKYLSKRGWRDFSIIIEMEKASVYNPSYDIVPHGAFYDLQGHRLTPGNLPLKHGVYIRNGKKVVVK